MGIILKQVPLETVGFSEFAALAELLAHEEKVLGGMYVLIRVQETQVSELVPHIARHLVEKRIFAVDDFVVGERQNEIFGEGVEEGKSQLVLVKSTVDGILREIGERVVHPAHVPLQAEAEAAEIGWAGDAGPGGGFFGDGQKAGEALVGDLVEAADKRDGGEILASAELIGNPLAGFAGVVEVKHRGYGVYAQAVDVVLVEPE